MTQRHAGHAALAALVGGSLLLARHGSWEHALASAAGPWSSAATTWALLVVGVGALVALRRLRTPQ